MIHYELRCAADHGFDGWFRDSSAFEQQARRGQIACPTCADTAVQRALMAPSLSRGARPMIDVPHEPPAREPPSRDVNAAAPAPAAPVPDEVRVFLQRLRAAVEQTCTYVGPAFADSARRMHDGEIEAKPIYGEATRDEAEALHDDGIDIARIPWVPRSDS